MRSYEIVIPSIINSHSRNRHDGYIDHRDGYNDHRDGYFGAFALPPTA